MPSSPGDEPVIITIHAGQVIGGSQLRSRPHIPDSIRLLITGNCGRKASNTSDGSAQSRPRTATFEGIAFSKILEFNVAYSRLKFNRFTLADETAGECPAAFWRRHAYKSAWSRCRHGRATPERRGDALRLPAGAWRTSAAACADCTCRRSPRCGRDA